MKKVKDPKRRLTVIRGRKYPVFYYDSSKSSSSKSDEAKIKFTKKHKRELITAWNNIDKDKLHESVANWIRDERPSFITYFQDLKNVEKIPKMDNGVTSGSQENGGAGRMSTVSTSMLSTLSSLRSNMSRTEVPDTVDTVEAHVKEHSDKMLEEINDMIKVLENPERFQLKVNSFIQFHRDLTPSVDRADIELWADEFIEFLATLMPESLKPVIIRFVHSICSENTLVTTTKKTESVLIRRRDNCCCTIS